MQSSSQITTTNTNTHFLQAECHSCSTTNTVKVLKAESTDREQIKGDTVQALETFHQQLPSKQEIRQRKYLLQPNKM